MSYSRPSASAADATFVGASAFSLPSASAAHAYFPIEPRLISSLHSTQFGTPNVKPGYVPGFKSTQFGAVVGYQKWDVASIGPLIKFSWTQAVQAAGEVMSRFGTPVATSTVTIHPTQIGSVQGFSTTNFGTPVIPTHVTVSGFAPMHFGTPSGQRRQVATALHSITFGTPTAQRVQRVTALVSTAFGTPKAKQVQQVSGLAPTVRWGLPVADILGTYKVLGQPPRPRFGRPQAITGQVRQVSGFKSTAFGTPAVRERHRVTMIPPMARFGTPIVRRSAEC